jgi:2'-5' RNA ligase
MAMPAHALGDSLVNLVFHHSHRLEVLTAFATGRRNRQYVLLNSLYSVLLTMSSLSSKSSKDACDTQESSICNSQADPIVNDPYKSSSFIGISLWMCPGGAAGEACTKIIQELAQEYGTFADFIPHITLVAALLIDNAVEQTRKVATMIAPYEFEIEEASDRDAYFQSVFFKMKTSPTVVQNNQIARQVFQERQRDPPYMPHLSLVYGNLKPQQKERIKRELCEKLKWIPKKMMVDAIQVWSTRGHVEGWYCIETIPLTGTR